MFVEHLRQEIVRYRRRMSILLVGLAPECLILVGAPYLPRVGVRRHVQYVEVPSVLDGNRAAPSNIPRLFSPPFILKRSIKILLLQPFSSI